MIKRASRQRGPVHESVSTAPSVAMSQRGPEQVSKILRQVLSLPAERALPLKPIETINIIIWTDIIISGQPESIETSNSTTMVQRAQPRSVNV